MLDRQSRCQDKIEDLLDLACIPHSGNHSAHGFRYMTEQILYGSGVRDCKKRLSRAFFSSNGTVNVTNRYPIDATFLIQLSCAVCLLSHSNPSTQMWHDNLHCLVLKQRFSFWVCVVRVFCHAPRSSPKAYHINEVTLLKQQQTSNLPPITTTLVSCMMKNILKLLLIFAWVCVATFGYDVGLKRKRYLKRREAPAMSVDAKADKVEERAFSVAAKATRTRTKDAEPVMSVDAKADKAEERAFSVAAKVNKDKEAREMSVVAKATRTIDDARAMSADAKAIKVEERAFSVAAKATKDDERERAFSAAAKATGTKDEYRVFSALAKASRTKDVESNMSVDAKATKEKEAREMSVLAKATRTKDDERTMSVAKSIKDEP
jgi:hypothetical protein